MKRILSHITMFVILIIAAVLCRPQTAYCEHVFADDYYGTWEARKELVTWAEETYLPQYPGYVLAGAYYMRGEWYGESGFYDVYSLLLAPEDSVLPEKNMLGVYVLDEDKDWNVIEIIGTRGTCNYFPSFCYNGGRDPEDHTTNPIYDYPFNINRLEILVNRTGVKNKQIIIEEGITELDDASWYNDYWDIISITLPKGIELSGEELRYLNNRNLSVHCEYYVVDEKYTVIDNAIYNRDVTKLICYPKDRTYFEVPDTVERLGESACYLSSLEGVIELPRNVWDVKHGCFADNQKITGFRVLNCRIRLENAAFQTTVLPLGSSSNDMREVTISGTCNGNAIRYDENGNFDYEGTYSYYLGENNPRSAERYAAFFDYASFEYLDDPKYHPNTVKVPVTYELLYEWENDGYECQSKNTHWYEVNLNSKTNAEILKNRFSVCKTSINECSKDCYLGDSLIVCADCGTILGVEYNETLHAEENDGHDWEIVESEWEGYTIQTQRCKKCGYGVTDKSIWKGKLIFDANGGTVEEESRIIILTGKGPASDSAKTAIESLPIPVRDGYVFSGWYTEDGNQVRENTSIKVGNETTLYAYWKEAITVSFDAGEGTVEVENLLATLNTENGYATLPEIPKAYREVWYTKEGTKKSGYSLSGSHTGWYTADGEELKTNRLYKTEDTTLYAQWAPNYYGVWFVDSFEKALDYDAYDCWGVLYGSTIKEEWEEEEYRKFPAPSKKGCTFDGWYTEDGVHVTEDTILNSDLLNGTPDGYEWNLLLYPRWSPKLVTVSFDTNGGAGEYEPLSVQYENTYGELPQPQRAGYTFLYWSTKKQADSKYAVNSESVVATEADIQLYAIWEKNSYSIRFALSEEDVTNGTYLEQREVVFGDTISSQKLPAPSREGFFFGGWYTAADGGVPVTNDTIMDADMLACLTENGIILYPHWIEDTDWGDMDESQKEYFEHPWLIPTGLWVTGITDEVYRGKAVTFADLKVYYGRKLLVPGKDYTVKYSNNNKVADASLKKAPSVTIVGKGNYSGTVVKKFSILSSGMKLITSATISPIKSCKYTGEEITPAVVVKYGKKTKLVEGVDYTVSYSNNVYAGTATVTITGIEEAGYTGSKSVSFKITGTRLSKAKLVIDKNVFRSSVPYTGYPIFQEGYSITYGKNESLRTLHGVLASEYDPSDATVDYTVSYKNNVKAGTATMILKGVGAFSGTITKTFKITKYSLTSDVQNLLSVEFEEGSPVTYAKGGAKPNPVVSFNGQQLSKDNYTISYNKSYTAFRINGKGSLSGKTAYIPYQTEKQNLKNLKITAADRAYSTKKGAYKSIPVVTDLNGKLLSSKTDFTPSYTYEYDTVLSNGTVRLAKEAVQSADIVPVGAVIRVTVTGCGNYEGEISACYRIMKTSISSASASAVTQEYTGNEIVISKSDITVKIGKKKLTTADFEIVEGTYKNNVKSGTASVVIRGKGIYGGTKTVKFKIAKRAFK